MYYSPAKIAGIAAALLIALLLSLPNVLPKAQQTYFRDTFGLRPMTLGLDLQGGSNVLMEIDRTDLTDKLKIQLASDARAALREARIAYSNLQRLPDGVSVKVTKPEDFEKARTALVAQQQPIGGSLLSSAAVNLFDLKTDDNGTFTLTLSPEGLDAKIQGAVHQSLTIVERRINSTGTTEPVIQQQGKDRIAVQLPGLQDPERVKQLLGQTAKLTFQLLCEQQRTSETQPVPQDCRQFPVKADITDPNLPKTLWVQTSSRATVDGGDLNDAQPSFDQTNDPVVTFRFNQKGAVKFGKLTAENVDKPFAIILDDVIQSFPVIRSPILGGTGQISGRFTTEETANLAIVLRSGALPAKLTIVEERTVGPSLGSDSINAGFLASVIGLIGVMAFMFLPYGFFGVIANLALLGNLLLLIAIMSFFGFTLTLPGIAGIVLTLGMAVDSNVLIYERIREEWRNGRTALNAIETGFRAALGTVLDANITTLIAAVVLFGIGSGPIRGFAVTLAVGIFTTMFTAFTLTRLLTSLWVKWTRPKEINL
jgi:protein-export membrane protein SecD